MIRFTTALMCLLAITVPACSLFHHGDSQPQQFMNALNRGSSAQASQLWLTMSAKDRADLSHGVGFQKTVNKDDIGRAMFKHRQEEEAKERADNPDDPANTATYTSDNDSTQVELPGNPADVGLSNLPLFNAAPSAPITEIGPQ